MTPNSQKWLFRVLAVLSAFGAAFAGLIVSASWWELSEHFCNEIPYADWEDTANCADGYFAVVLFGSAMVAGVLLFCWSVWRLRHV